MKKTDARVRYTKRVLKEAFLTLLKQKPVNKITVKEVCELAEVNRATFYTHYSDCFALLEGIEQEILDEFQYALKLENFFDVTALIQAIYEMVDRNDEACQLLIFQSGNSTLLQKMIDVAKDKSIALWKQRLWRATDTELEMMYIHLSNGLMHVVVDGYDKYSREDVIKFVNRVVKNSLAMLQ